MRIAFTGIITLAIALAGCNTAGKKYVKPYFDFDSLIHVQEHLLKSTNASIVKKASVNGHEETVKFTPDTTQWKNELEIFSQLDVINKPLYRKAYKIEEGQKDSNSNLVIKSYTCTINSPVPYIRFFYQTDINKIRKIEARYEEKNSLFSTVRLMTLEFDQINGQTTIEKYTMSGKQKMILTDSTSFDIAGIINFTSH